MVFHRLWFASYVVFALVIYAGIVWGADEFILSFLTGVGSIFWVAVRIEIADAWSEIAEEINRFVDWVREDPTI